jgi:hypothetical protein
MKAAEIGASDHSHGFRAAGIRRKWSLPRISPRQKETQRVQDTIQGRARYQTLRTENRSRTSAKLQK